MKTIRLAIGQALELSLYEVIALRELIAEVHKEPRELMNTITVRLDEEGHITAEAHYEDGTSIGVSQWLDEHNTLQHDAWQGETTGRTRPEPCDGRRSH